MGMEDDILRVLDSRRGELLRPEDLAAQVGAEVTVVEGYLDRLERKGEVNVARTFGGCEAAIAPLGVVRVYERSAGGQRLVRAAGPGAQPRTAREEAIVLLRQAADALETEITGIETSFMQLMRAAHLLGRSEMYQAAFSELNGYAPSLAVPWWRQVYATRQHVGQTAADNAAIVAEYPGGLPLQREIQELRDPLHLIVRSVDVGISLGVGPVTAATIGGATVNLVEVRSLSAQQVRNALGSARQYFYALAVAALAEAEFGGAALSILQDYVSQVDARLGGLSLGDSLRVARQNLRPGDEETCRQAVFAVRHALIALSRTLWRASPARYELLGLDLQGVSGVELVKNKLRAWLHQSGLRRHGEGLIEQELVWLADLANALWDFECKTAKGSVTYEDARTCLIATYVFLGEVATRTDLEPVTDENLSVQG